jgi:hypothetical protein
MAEINAQPLQATPAMAAAILAAAKRKYVASGGIEAVMSPDGTTVTFRLKNRRGLNDDRKGDQADIALFPVDVAQVGGSAGDGTNACSFTYDVTSLDGRTLASGVSPVWARPAIGKMTAATHGDGYYDSDGEFVLYRVDEVPATVKRSC